MIHQVCQLPDGDLLDALLLEQGGQSVQDQRLGAAIAPLLFYIVGHVVSSLSSAARHRSRGVLSIIIVYEAASVQHSGIAGSTNKHSVY